MVDEGGLVGIAQGEEGPLTYTDRFLSSLMALISIFRLPMLVVVVVYGIFTNSEVVGF